MQEVTYEGKPCVNGHGTTRYVANKHCVECAKAAQNRHRDVNREAVSAQRKRHYAENKETLAAVNAEWRANNKAYRTAYDRAYRYEWPPGETFETLHEKQAGKCASCGDAPQGGREVHVDHCHDTSKVRGILCRPCNLALGHMQDNPDRLRKLADYIERNS